jgi:hypothetical protein
MQYVGQLKKKIFMFENLDSDFHGIISMSLK